MIYYLFFPVYDAWEAMTMYFLLLASVVSLWIPKLNKVWPGFYLLALAFGLLDGRVTPAAWIPIALLAACTFLKAHFDMGVLLKAAVNLTIFVIGIDMFYHIMPGFHNWKILSQYTVSTEGAPFNLYLNVDKITVGLFLASGLLPLCQVKEEWTLAVKKALWILPLAALSLMGITLLLGYVSWDPKLPAITPLWLLTNLFFVSFTEEVFYRGFIQNQIFSIVGDRSNGKWLAISASAVLFGINHFPGGITYIFLSAFAGLFYGYGYDATKRIETSILIHFGVNTLHFFFFTYPSILT